MQSLFRSDSIGTEALFYFDAFSSREPVSTSLENALNCKKPKSKRRGKPRRFLDVLASRQNASICPVVDTYGNRR
jgi:hypothetical protein